MIKLIIADDHQLLIEGLISVLSEVEGIMMLEPVNDGKQLINSLRSNTADIVLLDLNMPNMDGIKALEVLKQEFSRIKIIVLTNYNQPQLVEKIKKLGADGYILKSSASLVLKEAIFKVSQGESYFEQELISETEPNHYFIDDFMKKFQLTRREVEIIRMIEREFTSKTIADALYISEFTVSTHRKNIMKKLGVKNVAGLMNIAQQFGIADI
ncbi:response regulator transcription factor [Daejeonella sp.]|uniref:response regulator transcription factor n=1 Tax=Daejeonella sp. TaxID=2805397 RepID=UPI0030C42606